MVSEDFDLLKLMCSLAAALPARPLRVAAPGCLGQEPSAGGEHHFVSL